MNSAPPLDRLSGIFELLIDDRVGVIHHVEEVRREAGAPDYFHCAAQACNTRAFNRFANFSHAGGAATDLRVAAAKAVGEAVERYCAAQYEIEELPLCSHHAAPMRCVPPETFALHSAEQYAQDGFPWLPFGADTAVRWTPALDPLTDETWYVPAALVFIPYQYYHATGDTPIAQPISTGLACHCSPAEAAVAAACEVIERDAFTLTWQARIAPPQILVETLSDANYDRVQRFERTGGEVTLFRLTLDLPVPTVLAVLRNEVSGAPALVFAAATDLNPEQAVRKSLEELAHTARYSQQIHSRLPRLAPAPDHGNVMDQVSHLNFWCDHAHAPFADFLFASADRVVFDELPCLPAEDPRRGFAALARHVGAAGHRILVADLTTPDVRPLGLTVVRALIPGFHPLFMGHRIRALGGSRLWSIPQTGGYPGISAETGDNPLPHPYP